MVGCGQSWGIFIAAVGLVAKKPKLSRGIPQLREHRETTKASNKKLSEMTKLDQSSEAY